MITNLKLKQIRGIEFAEFTDLAPVNIILGGNNTGKTSVLEALALLFGNQKQLESLPSLFRQKSSDQDDWNSFGERSQTTPGVCGFREWADDPLHANGTSFLPGTAHLL